jgi:hypothetical protein
LSGNSDVPRLIVYLAAIGAITFLGAHNVVTGDAVVGLIGAVAGYAAGRVVNGVKR